MSGRADAGYDSESDSSDVESSSSDAGSSSSDGNSPEGQNPGQSVEGQNPRQSVEQHSSSIRLHSATQRQELFSHAHAATVHSSESMESFTAVYNSRIHFGLTLADCELELVLTKLTIKPKSPGVEFDTNTVDLDDHVGYHGGHLVWGVEPANFSKSCTAIHLEGTFLVALCSHGEHDSTPVQARLDLNKYITYTTRHGHRWFEAVIPNRALTNLLSSSSWMNLAVVTRPDIFTNPTFQAAIRDVAQNSVDEVVKGEMKQALQLVIERTMAFAVEQAKSMIEQVTEIVSTRSKTYVDSQLETLIKTTAHAGTFYGLGGLAVMSLDQKHAYNVFAPTISASLIPEEE